MIKNILKVVGTLVLGVGLGFLLWLSAFNGNEKLKAKIALPEAPQGNLSGIYYESLDDNEKIAYELIMAEITEMPEKILIPPLEEDELSDVFEALIYENPTYFFLSDNCKTETTSFGNCYFIPEYSMNIVEYLEDVKELEGVRDTVLEKSQGISDEFEKEVFIHDYIVEKCEYEDKTGGTYSSAYGCLVEGKASCEGYAKAMKYLLDECGYENYLVTGTTQNDSSKTEGHAWNMVKIKDEYYHVDVTWDDPEEDYAENRYAYLNITDKEISKTHNTDERFLGKCNKNDENYYVKNRLYFSQYDGDARSVIASEIAKQVRLGNDFMSFKMKDKDALKDAKEALFDMNGIYSILLSASMLTNEFLSQDTVSYAVDEIHNIIVITDFTE